MKPFLHQPFNLGGGAADTKPTLPPAAGGDHSPPPPFWVGRSIATHRLRLLEHTAYVEQGEGEAAYKHLFVHIPNTVTYTDPLLEVG